MLKLALWLSFVGMCWSDSEDLYNTKTATSDLRWTTYPRNGGWEELSNLDLDGKIIRSYQVCDFNKPNPSNWVRTPFIQSRGAKRAYIDVEFSMMECNEELQTNCRETFNLYYFESDSDEASSTYPPWRENPYIKIDTIAAGERFSSSDTDRSEGVNLKTWTLGPLSRSGFYIAAHDQGACMSILSLRVYYFFCPSVVKDLANFPLKVAGNEVTSLDKVIGKCVVNANSTSEEGPLYYCNSNGKWIVRTGVCSCVPGYQVNSQMTRCEACGLGRYKSSLSNHHKCRLCPKHSISAAKSGRGNSSMGPGHCVCMPGYYRTKDEDIHSPCTKPPSGLTAISFNATADTVSLRWKPPLSSGGRSDFYYNVTCYICPSNKTMKSTRMQNVCSICSDDVMFHPSNRDRLFQTHLSVTNLRPFTSYRFQIQVLNGVSIVSKESPAHKTIDVKTEQSVPSKVIELKSVSKDRHHLNLTWSAPLILNGIISNYEVSWVPLSSSFDGGTKHSPENTLFIEKDTNNASIGELSTGTLYKVRVRAATAAGYGPYSDTLTLQTLSDDALDSLKSSPSSISVFVWIALIAVLMFLVVIGISVFFCRKKKLIGRKRMEDVSSLDEKDTFSEQGTLIVALPPVSNNQRIYVEYPDPRKAVSDFSCEIDPSRLQIESNIGEGEFGEVCRGRLRENNGTVFVAVKKMKEKEKDHFSFLREASTMAQFSHPNVLQLKGVITKSFPHMIVTEFMENGSLDSYLQKKKGQLSILQLLGMLRGVASGMRYLSEMKYVHRDLAARNILVNSDNVCKVSDFGLSRTLENNPHATYTTQGGKIAIRWTAPECILYRKFTSASDVWSFGIVMWEVMSYGEKPYWDITNQEVMESIEEGYRLPAPYECPVSLHRLMVECWAFDAAQRPSMEKVCKRLDDLSQHPTALTHLNLQVPNGPTTPRTEEAKPFISS